MAAVIGVALIGLAIPAVRDLPASWFTSAANTVAKYSYGIYILHVPALWVSFVVCRTAATAPAP
jgi:peptidoglycan/LPS O-acetylase OafA/YrhL